MKIGIIGAGISGLTAAYELTKKGHEVTVFERSSVPGGLGTYLPVGKNYIERFYHHFFASDSHIIALTHELGLDEKLKFYTAKTGNFINGKIYPFSSPSEILQYTPLSLIDRFRCGMTAAFLKFLPFPVSDFDNISAQKWLKKYAGKATYEKVWGPILEGKFSQFAPTIPLLWLQMRLHDRTFKLGYFDSSAKTLFDGLIKEITKRGGKIKLEAQVEAVEENSEKIVITENGKKYSFDKAIITTVSPIAEKLIKSKLPEKYRLFLNSKDHLGAVCVILELKHSVQSQYWLNICEKNSPILVMIEHTNLIHKRFYDNKVIVYLANYIYRDNKRFKTSDENVIKEYSSYLKTINKNFDPSWIINAYVSRVPRTQTIFGLGYLKVIPQIQTPLKNVYLINIDQMYPHDRNLNLGVQLGKDVSKIINMLE